MSTSVSHDLPDRLVIGIDFGTTFSGVAEAYSEREAKADEIQVIRQWPGSHGITSEKVPSELAYGAPKTKVSEARPQYGSSSDSRSSSRHAPALSILSDISAALNDGKKEASETVRWGYQLRQDETRLRCIKLLLDPHQDIPAYISKASLTGELKRLQISSEGAVADYLKELLKHTEQILRRRYGDLFISTTRIDVVLSVPAVWSDTAKDATLRAAIKAASASGLPDIAELSLISEPEAAAVYTLQAIQPSILKTFDNFIVCDAGGGTVDLISYEIKERFPLRIEESTEGTGKCCGAAFLNMRFEQLIRSRLGEAGFTNLCRRNPRSWLEALKNFEEYVKRNYTADEDTDYQMDYNIPLPGVPDDPDAGIESGYITLASTEVCELFRPIIDDIIALIEGQISKLRIKDKHVAGILLVGGFGTSEYLFTRLKKRFGDPTPPPYSKVPTSGTPVCSGIEVLQPPNAWTAVVRGAVLRGLEGGEFVLSRKARYNYGVACSPRFNPDIHPESSREWNQLDEQWEARNQMAWHILKGQNLPSSEPILLYFYHRQIPDAEKTLTRYLIFNKADDAPTGLDERAVSTTPKLCSVQVDLNSVPERYFVRKTNSKGVKWQKLDYAIGMQFNSGNIQFDVRVGGVVYGEVVKKFE